MASARGCPHGGSPPWFLWALFCASAPWAQLPWEVAGPRPTEHPEHPSVRPPGAETLGWAPDPCLAEFAHLSLRTCNGAKIWGRFLDVLGRFGKKSSSSLLEANSAPLTASRVNEVFK